MVHMQWGVMLDRRDELVKTEVKEGDIKIMYTYVYGIMPKKLELLDYIRETSKQCDPTNVRRCSHLYRLNCVEEGQWGW